MRKWRLMVEEGRNVGHTFSQPGLPCRRDRAAPRAHSRVTRYEGVHRGAGGCLQSMDRPGSFRRTLIGAWDVNFNFIVRTVVSNYNALALPLRKKP